MRLYSLANRPPTKPKHKKTACKTPVRDTAARRAELAARRVEIAARVAKNPFEYITVEEAGILFAFGERSMRALLAKGAPEVFRKINPATLRGWLEANHDRLGKLVTHE